MSAAQIPGFNSTPAAEADWFTAILGGAILPGIVTVEKLKVGIDCDTKKAKGSDQPTSQDNGLDPAKFAIRVWMNSTHFAEWQEVLPHFNPRRPGRDRAPLEFLHPMTYELGIRHVRVISIESEQPSGRQGFLRTINVEEWFDKPKAVTKKKEVPVPASPATIPTADIARLLNATQNSLVRNRSRQLATIEEMDPNTFKSTNPASEENIEGSMFDDG